MKKIRYLFIVLGMLLSNVAAADVQVGIGIGLPNVSIGINIPLYPELEVVPGYPVYYAPRLEANLFFYDGLYWIYQDDYWYASSWYNGPWWVVEPEVVPVFILRVPVRYYRHPPAYFVGWRYDAPPRWGEHWGHDWNQHRSGWDRWDRRSVPPLAPQPVYQRQYSGDRYPRQVEQQHELHQQNYRYQPGDPVVQRHYEEQAAPKAAAQQEKQRMPEQQNDNKQQDVQRSAPARKEGAAVPNSSTQQKRGDDVKQPAKSTPQQVRPEVREQRPQGTSVPERQSTTSGNQSQAVTHTQPQLGGVNVQRPEPAVTQKGRQEVQERRQQPQQDAGRPGNNTTNEPRRRSDQEGSGGRYD